MAHCFTISHQALEEPEITSMCGTSQTEEESDNDIEGVTLDLHSPPDLGAMRKPALNPKLVARLQKLRETLTDIKTSVENRKLLIRLGSKNTSYNMYTDAGWKWKTAAEADNDIFNQISQNVKSLDPSQLTDWMLQEWEEKVEALRQNTLHHSDKIVTERKNWNASWLQEVPGDLKENWSFGIADGEGPGPDEEVDPKDTKKNRKDSGNNGGSQSRSILYKISKHFHK